MKAIARFFVAATLAFTLTVSYNARGKDHGSASGFAAPVHRPRAVCGAWGCYVFPKRGLRRFRNFSLFLNIGGYQPYYGYGGYNPYGYGGGYGYGYGGGYGYGYGAYGPYPPGDYRNAYAGLFGSYRFPPAY